MPSPAVEVKLRDVGEMGYLANASTPRGEICMRGPAIFKGYFQESYSYVDICACVWVYLYGVESQRLRKTGHKTVEHLYSSPKKNGLLPDKRKESLGKKETGSKDNETKNDRHRWVLDSTRQLV